MSEKNYQLVIRKGPKSGQVFDLIADVLTLGRDAVADIIIVDPEVSRQHLQFKQTDIGYQLQDLGSTNGTFINGRRLSGEWVDLVPGQEIMLGGSIVLLYREAEEDFVLPTLALADEEDIEVEAADLAEIIEINDLDDLDDLEDLDDEEWYLPEAEAEDIKTIFQETADSPSDDPPSLTAVPQTNTRPESPPPSPGPAVTEQRTGPLVPPGKGRNKRGRRTVVIASTLLMIACCCALLFFMYYIGGDLLLQYWGIIQ
jgi:pSer/pThr/pTyr-binding forkhead associated (FHA) protein